MQKLSIREFQDYCVTHKLKTYIFSIENQNWNKVGSTIGADIEFGGMIISFNPNAIRLKSQSGFLDFKGVRYIKLEEKSILGFVFTVICHNFSKEMSEDAYTIIGR